jgi:hypothetical protein
MHETSVDQQHTSEGLVALERRAERELIAPFAVRLGGLQRRLAHARGTLVYSGSSDEDKLKAKLELCDVLSEVVPMRGAFAEAVSRSAGTSRIRDVQLALSMLEYPLREVLFS